METKTFPISKGSIIRSLLFRLIMGYLVIGPFGIILTYLLMGVGVSRISPTLILFLAAIVILVIIVLSALRVTHDILLDGNQLTFVSFVRNTQMELGDLISIKDVRGGGYTQFKSKERSVLSMSNIKRWDELVASVTSVNPTIEIFRYSKVRRVLRPWMAPVFVVLIILIFGMVHTLIFTPGMFSSDPERIVEAIHKYHELHGRWPNELDEITPNLPDVDIKAIKCYYIHNNVMFILDCEMGMDDARFYRSDKKEFIYRTYKPNDRGRQEFEALLEKLRPRAPRSY